MHWSWKKPCGCDRLYVELPLPTWTNLAYEKAAVSGTQFLFVGPAMITWGGHGSSDREHKCTEEGLK
jgi:hypothetical protein